MRSAILRGRCISTPKVLDEAEAAEEPIAEIDKDEIREP